jgi:LiaI-LiaF-like transmembrane region
MGVGSRRSPHWAGVVWGILLILLGLLLTLHNIDIIRWSVARHFWPFIPIAIGLAKLLQPARRGRREGGLVLFGGVWLLLNNLGVLRYRDSWPLLLIGWGIAMGWDAIAGPETKAE